MTAVLHILCISNLWDKNCANKYWTQVNLRFKMLTKNSLDNQKPKHKGMPESHFFIQGMLVSKHIFNNNLIFLNMYVLVNF